jgi:hypothetical protein
LLPVGLLHFLPDLLVIVFLFLVFLSTRSSAIASAVGTRAMMQMARQLVVVAKELLFRLAV